MKFFRCTGAFLFGLKVLNFPTLSLTCHIFFISSQGKREPQNYLCHAWLDDRILVGTDTGDILLFENAEFRGVLESSPSDGTS